MPFQDDSGVKVEQQRGVLLSTFAVLADQVERMVALNIGWALILLPSIIGLAWPELPIALRVGLLAFSAAALPPATGALFGTLGRVCAGEPLRLEVVREALGELARPSYFTLLPLYGLFGPLLWLIVWALDNDLTLIGAAAQVLLLLLALCGMYWGAAFAQRPTDSAWAVLRRSVWLVWREPLQTLLASVAALLILLVSTISVGGLFLIAPVLLALLQTQLYRHATRKKALET